MSAANQQPSDAPLLPEIAEEVFCPKCGYNLKTLTSARAALTDRLA